MKRRILVLEDDETIRESLAEFLEDFDFEVCTAADAEEALELIAGQPLDASIVDLRLPGISGDSMIPLAHRLQPQLRFLIHTGSVGYHLPEELIRIGMRPEHILIKPLSDMMLLINRLNALFDET